jgi:hypothetical protein
MGPSNYRAYLLRLWRAPLEDVQTGKHIGFAGLDHLLVYLSQQLREEGETAQNATGREGDA